MVSSSILGKKLTLMFLAQTPVLDSAKSEKPDILFVLCGNTGWGNLVCYGQKYINTPGIDRHPSEGRQFVQGYAGSPYAKHALQLNTASIRKMNE